MVAPTLPAPTMVILLRRCTAAAMPGRLRVMTDSFRHVDAARTVFFGEGALEEAAGLLGDGYVLLATRRAAAAAPAVVQRAAAVCDVPHGLVEEVAGDLLGKVRAERLVALGGGRVVDVAKALAAAGAAQEVGAAPTSLAAAEMTGVHRHARGVPGDTPRVRPSLVINDPRLSASQPVDALAASTANALGHAVTALASARSTPIARAVGGEAARRLMDAWAQEEPRRATLALGALLAGWAVDHSGLGPHHVLAQTAVRTASLAHARANAALLPSTVRAMAARAALDPELERCADRLRRRAGADLGAMGTDEAVLERAVEAALRRPELERVPPPFERDEVRRIYRAAA